MKIPPRRTIEQILAEHRTLVACTLFRNCLPRPPRTSARTLALGILCGLLALAGIFVAAWSVDVLLRDAVQQSSRP